MHNRDIFSVTHRINDSPIWSDLLKVKDIYLQGKSIKIEKGYKTRFWSDPWLYDKPLCIISPILFTSCHQKEVFVAEVMSGSVQITFRRWLTPELHSCWNVIQSDMHKFRLHDFDDVVLWKFEKSGKFSVKSLYNALTSDDSGPFHKNIWKGKVPQKIKIFIWLLTNNATHKGQSA